MIVACVRTGTKYGFDYVINLRNMVQRFACSIPHRLVCLTDQPDRCHGVEFVDVTRDKLPGWWAKMIIFKREWRVSQRVVFLDLDTVIIGSLVPLLHVDVRPYHFGICDNFARLAGSTNWPCKYNSSIMVLGAEFDMGVWEAFNARRRVMIEQERYGDQMVIEQLVYPHATILQNALPPGYLLNYRKLTEEPPPKETAIVNFGGRRKPHNSEIEWVKRAWA